LAGCCNRLLAYVLYYIRYLVLVNTVFRKKISNYREKFMIYLAILR
jgi:hypothetical protein